jgi:hypothetical protein
MTAHPTDRQRAAIRGILAWELRPPRADRVLIHFAPHRATEAAWICAYVRARGGRAVARATGPGPAAAVERGLASEPPAPGTAVVVLADATLRLPPGALHLAGTDTHSPLDLWQPVTATAADVAGLIRDMRPRMTVCTGGRRLECETGHAAPGDPDGTAEAPLTRAGGVFVADGAIAVNRPTTWDARLRDRPVTVTLDGAGATAVDCADLALRRFLTRALRVHGAGTATALRFGSRRVTGGYTAAAGPVNAVRRGVTLRLAVADGQCAHGASADLRIDLTAATGDWS